MEMLKTINFIIAVIFFVCYTYQFLYIPVPWLRKEKPHGPGLLGIGVQVVEG